MKFCTFLLVGLLATVSNLAAEEPVRVFIFAGQSNMVGSDSHVEDIKRFPPFAGLEKPQSRVRFSYNIGRDHKTVSKGWVDLQPVNGIVGPELSFAQQVAAHIEAPIAIIKVAAGGTHLGGDWNPAEPAGFKMYPLALAHIQAALAEFKERKIAYRIEGFMWHQGENDMFNEEYKKNYGANLKNFIAAWRRDLRTPKLRFYVGELCTKTIWGMDLRPRMYAISLGQKEVADADPLVQYIPTSHVGVEIGGGVGLHYHYGTLGQLEHGENYAAAYLRNIHQWKEKSRKLATWPYPKASKIKLFVLAGHRNMEGERAFVQDLKKLRPELARDDASMAFRYRIGGGVKQSHDWEPLGPAGYYDTFGPELAFGHAMKTLTSENIAIAKFTHSGSQMNDWTPAGSEAKSRHLYPTFIKFVQQSVASLEAKGHEVELAGVFYHVGENEMSMPPYRRQAAQWLKSTIAQSRIDLKQPDLLWCVSQQPPTDHERVNTIDVTAQIEALAKSDSNVLHIKAFDLPKQEKQLVIDTAGIVWLGELIARRYSERVK